MARPSPLSPRLQKQLTTLLKALRTVNQAKAVRKALTARQRVLERAQMGPRPGDTVTYRSAHGMVLGKLREVYEHHVIIDTQHGPRSVPREKMVRVLFAGSKTCVS